MLFIESAVFASKSRFNLGFALIPFLLCAGPLGHAENRDLTVFRNLAQELVSLNEVYDLCKQTPALSAAPGIEEFKRHLDLTRKTVELYEKSRLPEVRFLGATPTTTYKQSDKSYAVLQKAPLLKRIEFALTHYSPLFLSLSSAPHLVNELYPNSSQDSEREKISSLRTLFGAGFEEFDFAVSAENHLNHKELYEASSYKPLEDLPGLIGFTWGDFPQAMDENQIQSLKEQLLPLLETSLTQVFAFPSKAYTTSYYLKATLPSVRNIWGLSWVKSAPLQLELLKVTIQDERRMVESEKTEIRINLNREYTLVNKKKIIKKLNSLADQIESFKKKATVFSPLAESDASRSALPPLIVKRNAW